MALGATNRAVQEKLVEIAQTHRLTQIHELPTRQDSHLDLVFTSNPSLIKASANIPGLSDHDAAITDMTPASAHTELDGSQGNVFALGRRTGMDSGCRKHPHCPGGCCQ